MKNFLDSFETRPVPALGKDVPWLDEIRQKAYRSFRQSGFPTRKMESWRYVDLGPLLAAVFHEPDTAHPKEDLGQSLENYYPMAKAANRLVFLNGLYSPGLSSAGELPEGTVFQNLKSVFRKSPETLKSRLADDITSEKNPFALINAFSFAEGAFIHIPREVQVEEPLHLFFIGVNPDGRPLLYHPRILIVLEPGARAYFVLHLVGCHTAPSLMNTVGEIYLGEGAQLDYANVQRQSQESFQFLRMRCRLAGSSQLKTVHFSRGGAILRSDTTVDLFGEHAGCFLNGLSLLSKQSFASHEVRAIHCVPYGTSRQTYKSILADSSKSEFTSLSHVLRNAHHADSRQLNRNLLLSDAARAWSRPQLKIYADDVAASHGSANGRMNDQELFYLRSRGLNPKIAQFVLACGFADEVLEQIDLPQIRGPLEDYVRYEIRELLNMEPGEPK